MDSSLTGHGGRSVLSASLLAELAADRGAGVSSDALETMVACMRTQESASLFLQCGDVVWPITVFPKDRSYHSRRDLEEMPAPMWKEWRVLEVAPAGVAPPSQSAASLTHDSCCRPLIPLLLLMALHGSRSQPLREIAGKAAYRVLRSPESHGLQLAGALGSAVARLRRETASLADIASWPGLDVDRASRLLNALYLSSNLMVLRTHRKARGESARGGMTSFLPALGTSWLR